MMGKFVGILLLETEFMLYTRYLMDRTMLLMTNVRTWNHKVDNYGVIECGERERG